MTQVEFLEIRVRYLDESIAYSEKELAGRRAFRERLVMDLNRARRLEREELQNGQTA